MSQRRSGLNAFIESLKSLVTRQNQPKFGRNRQRSGLWASESLESRELLSSTSLGNDFTKFQAVAPQISLKAHSDFLTGPDPGAPLDIAKAYLQANSAALGLSVQDINSLKVTNNYQSSGSKVTHIYFQQVVNGLPVVNSNLNINIARNGEVINVGSSILPSVGTSTPAPNPQLSAIQALNAMVASLGWTYEGTPQVLSTKPLSAPQETVISSAGISMAAEIPASLRYVPKNDGSVELAWLLNIQTTDSSSWYDAAVSASTGQVLNLEDWVNQASYRGVEIPFENPQERATAIIVDPQLRGVNASPFGWHDTNGAAGAEFTDTRGNNVNAQEDKDANNTGGVRPDGGAGLLFDFPFNPGQSAQANESAATVNLFYWNNVIHDVLYNYGFDEVSGNFQNNNYGNGGAGADQVEADSLDGSGTNNANFATPPDGISGRMQMYEFTFTSPTRDSDMDNFIIVHEFGHGLTNRLTGGPANSGALQLAQSRGMGEGWSDFLGLMMVQKASDTQFGAYSAGNYVLGSPLNDPNGGIRDFPYSFDMTISPKTYGYFNAFTFPHPNGEIIAATLWDLNWLMINGNGTSITAKGYEPDIYDFASGAGNTELMQVFVEALKLQPANPTYLDFRDAMLNADLAITGGDNEVAIWTTFARRGMGWSAFDGGSAASNNVREAFDMPPGLLFEFIVNPNPVAENAGVNNVGGATAVIKRPTTTPITAPLVVTLTSNDITEIQVPATITIPAGSPSVTFQINVIDDTLLDGTQIVQLRGTATIFGRLRTATAVVSVLDHETLSVQIDRASVRENAGPGAASLTVTRSNTDSIPPDTFVVLGDNLLQFDYNGVLIKTTSIPWPAGIRPLTENAHDLVMLQNGTIAVYNGTTNVFISIFNPVASTWQHFQISGLTTDVNDPAMGGIASWGQYIFASDMESTPGNPFGVVRLDLTTGAITRFGTKALGSRLFVKDVFGVYILEVDPITGATLNTLPMPITPAANNGFNNGLAYNGTDLWLLAGGIGNDQIYQLDGDTGAVKDIHHLGGDSGWDGLGWLNGRLYALDNDIENRIAVYDPKQRRVVATLNVGTLNNVNISGGLSGITGPDRLLVTSASGDQMYEINPVTGIVTATWNTGLSTTEYGVGVAGGEVYVGEFSGGQLKVFNRSGVFQRFVDVTLSPTEGVFAIGGDDIPGLTTTSYRYRDVAAGLDDKLYALDVAGTTVGKFNPSTTALEGFVNVANPVNALAVASDGTIWGAGRDGSLYHFSSSGALLSSLVTGVAELIDIDLNITGQLLLTSRDGTVIQANTSLTSPPVSFSAGASPAFITLGRHQTLPAGDAIVLLSSSDLTEIRVPLQVIIPIGQQSGTVLFDAIDDNILDGTQVVTITASAVGYVDTTDTINVLDVETMGIDIIADQISEAAGAGATQVRVFRTNVDGPFPYTSKHVVSNNISQTILDYDKTNSQIAIPDQTSRISDVNVTLNLQHGWLADLDIYLISPAGTRVELVTDLNGNGSLMTNTTFDDAALGSILVGAAPYTGKFRPEGLLLAMNGENPSGIWTLEITDDNQSDFGTLFSWSLDIQTLGLAPQLVNLSLTGDPGEISVQQSVTIPANQASILIPLNALDDMLLDGTRIAGIQANANVPGFELGSDNVEVLDQETLTFTINKTQVSEAAGPGALTGTLTRFNTDISLPFPVSFSSNDLSELTIGDQQNPASPINPMVITIPAGQSSVTFNINAIDDVTVDGDQTVVITVSAPAYGANITRTVIVEDLEPSLKLTTGTPVVAENSGSFMVTVSRLDQADLSAEMILTVTVDPGLQLSSGPTFTIPAGLDSVTFLVSVDDNARLDGTRTASIHATSSLIPTANLEITITDYETLTLTVDKSSFLENAGVNAAIGTVRRSNTENLGQALVVALTSSDVTELSVPSSVTIPAGQASATFVISAVNDPELDGIQNVTITATYAAYVDGTVGIAVLDHEPPVLTGPPATTPSSRPKITWNALSGAIRYDVWISNLSTGVNSFVRNIRVLGTSFVPPENLGIGRYRVWVRAIDALEVAGYWSVGRDFFVNTPPTITSPTPNAVIASSSFPTITWSAVPDAVKYELWVNNLTTGQNRVINRAGVTALTTTSYVSTENLPSGTYRIWVRGLNASGEAGLWSLPTTHTVLAQPVIKQPVSGGTFDSTPTFAWTAVTGATSYDLYVADAKTKVVVLRNKFVNTTSLTATTDIPSGEYMVWVRAQSGNSFSAWSVPSALSIGLPPRITSATTVGTPAKPQFAWTAITGTERYELWVNNAANQRVIYETTLTNTAFTAATTLPAGTYRVWVRAVSTMGVVTAWSSAVNLVIASSVLPKSSVDSAQTMILASLILAEEPLIPDGSTIERPAASALEADASVNAEYISNTAVPADSVAKSINSIEAGPVVVSEHDAVMSEWQSAEWWTGTSETQDRKELQSTAAIAAGLGIVVSNGQRPNNRRKRNS